MKTFKQFLAEEVIPWTISDCSEERLFVLLNGECKKHVDTLLDKRAGFFRGDRSWKSDYFILDTDGMHRDSKATNNFYQMCMDNDAELSKFPSRSKSIICSTSSSTARSYGDKNIFMMLPLNDAIVTASKVRDLLFFKFKPVFGYSSADDFNSAFSGLAKIAGVPPSDGNYGRGNASFDRCQKAISKLTDDRFLFSISTPIIGNTLSDAARAAATQVRIHIAQLVEDFEGFYYKDKPLSDETVSEILKVVENHQERIRSWTGQTFDDFKAILKLFKADKAHFLENITSKILNSDSLGIEKITTASEVGKDNECWINGKMLVINYSKISELVVKAKKQ